MPNGHFKSLTLSKTITTKFDLNSEKLDKFLIKIMKDKEELQNFAAKIEVIPEIVRNYTPTPKRERE